jgi:hypothetical protein
MNLSERQHQRKLRINTRRLKKLSLEFNRISRELSKQKKKVEKLLVKN